VADPAGPPPGPHFTNPFAGESADAPAYFGYDQVGNLPTSELDWSCG